MVIAVIPIQEEAPKVGVVSPGSITGIDNLFFHDPEYYAEIHCQYSRTEPEDQSPVLSEKDANPSPNKQWE